MKPSNRTATINALTYLGFWTVTSNTSRRYVRLRIANHDATWFQLRHDFLIGKSGALRAVAPDQPVDSSISLTGRRLHRVLIELGQYNRLTPDQAHAAFSELWQKDRTHATT